MAQVLLVSTAATARDFWFDDFTRLRRCARADRFGVHHLTDDPGGADVILFCEPDDQQLARDITTHSYARLYPEKVFVFDPSDRVVPFLPGIYASIQRWQYDRSRVRSGCFPVVCDHSWIEFDPNGPSPTRLYSFIGDIRGIPVREALATLSHPRGFIRDTGSDPANDDASGPDEAARFHGEFAATLADSKFSLCPRGAGTSTFRLFESMRAGRVPVILSDDWVAPEGPDWDLFSLRIAERDAHRVPEILSRHEDAAEAMGRAAREQWDLWFSESVLFHRIVEWCLEIQRGRRRPERLMRTLVWWQLLEPFNFRHKLIPALSKAILPR